MKQVKIADLKNNLSRHLAIVRDGGTLVVLDRETPMARIVPFLDVDHDEVSPHAKGDERAAVQMADLERRGIVARRQPALLSAWLETTKPVGRPKGSPRASDLVIKSRRESQR